MPANLRRYPLGVQSPFIRGGAAPGLKLYQRVGRGGVRGRYRVLRRRCCVGHPGLCLTCFPASPSTGGPTATGSPWTPRARKSAEVLLMLLRSPKRDNSEITEIERKFIPSNPSTPPI
ncbi:hypothetical protein E2C01_010721 [Portunus trituberculatus]|uniref:Uncharacterized protein n=1 Tax=Portunus trituberculatus TaxID=210409 RepID=A0A5B7D9I9_PORTR|nr:hypothetical protein [Portunus trituberculatus]